MEEIKSHPWRDRRPGGWFRRRRLLKFRGAITELVALRDRRWRLNYRISWQTSSRGPRCLATKSLRSGPGGMGTRARRVQVTTLADVLIDANQSSSMQHSRQHCSSAIVRFAEIPPLSFCLRVPAREVGDLAKARMAAGGQHVRFTARHFSAVYFWLAGSISGFRFAHP